MGTSSDICRKNKSGGPILVSKDAAGLAAVAVVAKSLVETASQISKTGADLVVVTPHPQVSGFSTQQKRLRFSEVDQIYADYEAAKAVRDAIVNEFRKADVPFAEINGLELFCHNERCPAVNERGEFLLFDGAHISTILSGSLADRVADAIIAD